jgi:probable phosphoglycerate mutase
VRGFARAPNGETLAEVQARAVGLVVALRERHPEQRIALVSHGDTIKSVLAQALGIPLEFFLRLEVSPASISSIEFFPSDLRVLRVNFLPEPPD